MRAVKRSCEASASVPPQEARATKAEIVPHARRRQCSNADSAAFWMPPTAAPAPAKSVR
jgi:hypothetical protein